MFSVTQKSRSSVLLLLLLTPSIFPSLPISVWPVLSLSVPTAPAGNTNISATSNASAAPAVLKSSTWSSPFSLFILCLLKNLLFTLQNFVLPPTQLHSESSFPPQTASHKLPSPVPSITPPTSPITLPKTPSSPAEAAGSQRPLAAHCAYWFQVLFLIGRRPLSQEAIKLLPFLKMFYSFKANSQADWLHVSAAGPRLVPVSVLYRLIGSLPTCRPH